MYQLTANRMQRRIFVLSLFLIFYSSFVRAELSDEPTLVLIVSDLSDGHHGVQEGVYNFIEHEARVRAENTLRPFYRSILSYQGSSTNNQTVVEALSTATRGSKAVDLIFVTHGLDDHLYYSRNNSTTASALRDAILAGLSRAQRSRLRVVFSTACFGRSHIDEWLEAGFKVASGSNKIYADSAASYQPFLDSWAADNTFARAVERANGADPLDIWDTLASVYYRTLGGAYTRYANWVDSTRVVQGRKTMRISSIPTADDTVSKPTVLTPQAGGKGGRPGRLACPSGKVLTGVYGKAGGYIDRIGAICSDVTGTRVPRGNKQTKQLGGNGGNTFTRRCPTNFVVGGFQAKFGSYVERLRLRCYAINSQGKRLGRTGRYTSWVGGRGFLPTVTRQHLCSERRTAVGIEVRHGRYIDSIGLSCR